MTHSHTFSHALVNFAIWEYFDTITLLLSKWWREKSEIHVWVFILAPISVNVYKSVHISLNNVSLASNITFQNTFKEIV